MSIKQRKIPGTFAVTYCRFLALAATPSRWKCVHVSTLSCDLEIGGFVLAHDEKLIQSKCLKSFDTAATFRLMGVRAFLEFLQEYLYDKYKVACKKKIQKKLS